MFGALRGLPLKARPLFSQAHIKAQHTGLLYVSLTPHVFVKSRLITYVVTLVGMSEILTREGNIIRIEARAGETAQAPA